ncbi:hypothetical protein SAMN04488009_0159 [Maribacter sedimenticola]|uniref:Uncharacterized protein n=1 Tax=Maribacter sedimenticola TaxID=228956 RepID=A0ABY1SM86_9FLAO|nr:hypothetical protein [Maribacter sedimenticola]SNR80497.1 hypothetical protein SAMN04488009_0159 [Maribacter sedimenticola]
MDSGKTLKYLVNHLYNPLLFYIPKNIIPKDELLKFNGISTDNFFNTPVLISKKNLIHHGISINDYRVILEKASILNYNLLKLIDVRRNLNVEQFNTLIENYILHLRFYLFMTKWMNEHFTKYCKTNQSLKSYFQLQYDFFNQHKLAIQTKFNLNIVVDLTSSQILTYLKNDTPTPLNNIINTDKNRDIKKETTKKKTVLITDQEARNFLLKTVFGLKY